MRQRSAQSDAVHSRGVSSQSKGSFGNRLEEGGEYHISPENKNDLSKEVHTIMEGHETAQHFLAHSLSVRNSFLTDRLNSIRSGFSLYSLGDVLQHSFKPLVDMAPMTPDNNNSKFNVSSNDNFRFSPKTISPKLSAKSIAQKSLSKYDDANKQENKKHEQHHRFRELEAFQRTVLEETEEMPLPNNLEKINIPDCECGFQCAMRRYFYEGGEYHMWVCAKMNCMFWKTYWHSGGDNIPSEDDHNIFSGHSFIRSFSRFEHLSSEKQQELESVVMQRFGKIPQSVSEYWACMAQMMIVPDQHAAKFLRCQMEIKYCQCGVPMRLCLCKATGDIFFSCATENCFDVIFSHKQPPTRDLDMGQVVPLGCSILDHYTTLTYLMRWFGYSFSSKFWRKLGTSSPDTPFPSGSYPLEEQQEYDVFLSYRGRSPKFMMFSTLAAELNARPAFLTIFIVFPLIVVGLSYIPGPCENPAVPDWLIGMGSCGVPIQFRSWFVWQPYGSFLFVLIFLFYYPVFGFLQAWILVILEKLPTAFRNIYPGWRRIFFDKYCIHQSRDDYRSLGVYRIPLYLKESKKLVCLIDQHYIRRMWCVWELALYLKLRKRTKPRVQFVSISKRFAQLWSVVVNTLMRAILSIVDVAFDEECQRGVCFTILHQWMPTIIQVLIIIIVYLFGQAHFMALNALHIEVENYDVRKAQLGRPEDLEFLLTVVDELFREDIQKMKSEGRVMMSPMSKDSSQYAGSPASSSKTAKSVHQAGIEAFNDEVRHKVPKELPVRGVKSFKIFNYTTAIFMGAIVIVFHTYDVWSYDAPHGPWGILYLRPEHVREDDLIAIYFGFKGITGFKTVLAWAWTVFVVWPFGLYLQGLEVGLLLKVQECNWFGWGKLNYGWSVAIFLPIYLVLDCVFNIRTGIVLIISTLTTTCMLRGPTDQYIVYYSPYIQTVLFSDFENHPGGWLRIFEMFQPEPWIDALIAIFLIVYEPRWSVDLRSSIWDRFCVVSKLKTG
eukprot:gene986-1104_t